MAFTAWSKPEEEPKKVLKFSESFNSASNKTLAPVKQEWIRSDRKTESRKNSAANSRSSRRSSGSPTSDGVELYRVLELTEAGKKELISFLNSGTFEKMSKVQFPVAPAPGSKMSESQKAIQSEFETRTRLAKSLLALHKKACTSALVLASKNLSPMEGLKAKFITWPSLSRAARQIIEDAETNIGPKPNIPKTGFSKRPTEQLWKSYKDYCFWVFANGEKTRISRGATAGLAEPDFVPETARKSTT